MRRSALEVVADPGGLALACSADGEVVVVSDGVSTRITGGAVLEAAPAEAIAFGAGAIWLVARGRSGGHELRVFDRGGRPLADPFALGELGADIALDAGPHGALIHGARAVFVGLRRGGLAIEQLRAAGNDRFVLLGERGLVERRGGQLVALHGAHAPLALPPELATAVLVGGRAVLGGVLAALEVTRDTARQLVVFDLRRATVRAVIELGDATVAAIAERRGLAVLARGRRLEVIDLHRGAPIAEHALPFAITRAAIDADGRRLLALDVANALHDFDTRPPHPAELVPEPRPLDGDRPVLAADEMTAYTEDVEELVVAWADRAHAVRVKGPKARAAARLNAKLTERELDERWANTSGAPHNQLAAEHGLSPLELSLLLAVAVPHGWCRAAERVAALGGGARHGGSTETVLARLLDAPAAQAAALRAALDPTAPLVRAGLVRIGPGQRPFAPIIPSPAVVQRLLGLEQHAAGPAPRPASPATPIARIRCRSVTRYVGVRAAK